LSFDYLADCGTSMFDTKFKANCTLLPIKLKAESQPKENLHTSVLLEEMKALNMTGRSDISLFTN
jgi:hypothetical protein